MPEAKEPTHRFPIGTKFTTGGKHPRVCTVIDQLTTRNSTGVIVVCRYIATHEFMGQLMTNGDINNTNIARNLISVPDEV